MAVQDSDRAVIEDRGLSGFTRIDMRGIGDLVLTQGEADSVTVVADDDVISHVLTEVRDGTLVLSAKPGPWWRVVMRRHTTIRFEVTIAAIEALSLSGVGDVEAGPIRADELAVVLSGTGDITVESLDARGLAVTVSGAGEFEVWGGSVERQTVAVSGAGEYRADGMRSESADVRVSGAGEIRLDVRAHLDAVISGAGSIKYHGTPEVTRRISGVGSIKALGGREASTEPKEEWS